MPAKSPEAVRRKYDASNRKRGERRSAASGRPYVPHPLRGPATKPHYVPEGHELGGVSRLTDRSGDTIQEWSKTRVAGADEPPVPVPPDFLLKRSSVMRRGDGSTVVEWSSYEPEKAARFEAVKEAIRQHVAEYVRPAEPSPTWPTGTLDELLTVYPLGDPHVGMLSWWAETGESFDLKIAERELTECLRQLVRRSPPSRRCVVGQLGDFFHADSNRQLTPKSGHKLDVDGRAAKVGRVGLRILRAIVDEALAVHERVEVRNVPGNHDPETSCWLTLCLQALYEREPRVKVHDGFAPYQFDQHGKVALGWCHGDGAKLEALGEVMATDAPELWGATRHREWNVGHVHHLQVKELRGCVVRTHRTLAGRDMWHHHSGYRSGRSLMSLTYHSEYGLDSTATVGIDRVLAAIAESEAAEKKSKKDTCAK